LGKLGDQEQNHASDMENKKRLCLPSCEHQTMATTFTTSIFPVKATFKYSSYFCLALFKVARICQDPLNAKIFEASLNENDLTCKDILFANNTIKICSESGEPVVQVLNENPTITKFIYEYARNNFVVLQVYISDPYYTLFKRDEQISYITFISNTGGLLGLCMGMSFISIFEIVYHFFNIFWSKSQKCIQVLYQWKLKLGNAKHKVQKVESFKTCNK
jgi:hypothetical protein